MSDVMTSDEIKSIKSQLEKEFVSVEEKKQCLQTALYGVSKKYPFFGSTLQCMDIYYSHQVPRAGVAFNNHARKWEMLINPFWFCKKLTYENQEAILLHEIFHVTHKHTIRAPFIRVNEQKRHLLNIAMDMSINQLIKNLPNGCSQCPPKDQLAKGEECKNEMCPGGCIFVEDFFDVDPKTNKHIPWESNKAMEFYYHKLVERYIDGDDKKPNTIPVKYVFTDNADVTGTGVRSTKRLTSNTNTSITSIDTNLIKDAVVALVAQDNEIDNGIFYVDDIGSDTTPFILRRHKDIDGGVSTPMYIGDMAIPDKQKLKRGKIKAWVITGEARSADSDLILVDKAPIHMEEQDVTPSSGKGSSEGLPQEFDSHQWDCNADENEMMDATEELVKRAMQKRGLAFDKLPGFIQELLQDIDSRRAELNYRALILSAIKRNASGIDREYTWTRKNRRYGHEAPGTKIGNLPTVDNYIDTSGSISVEEANEFLSIVDEFLRVGSRKCNLGLWHTSLYNYEKYKLGNQLDRSKIQSGGTDMKCVLENILLKKANLNIVLTDGCYSNVEFESWMRPGEHFPQVLFVISKEGDENHPLKRLGQTIKIPKTDQIGTDRNMG